MWKEHGLDPNWIESIPYYEYQMWIEKLNQAVERENRESLEESGKKELFNFSK
jgi:G:T-mismatch repair DNA endonuclease (very short patch repair protein)